MDRVKGVLLIVSLLFAISTFYLFIQSSATESQLKAAQSTNAQILTLLRVQGIPCSTYAADSTGIGKCIAPALLSKDFKEDSFAQPDSKGESGYVVIKNINHATYNASSFTFFVNRELSQTGCTISGNIEYNTACRFNFAQHCDKGTVLEVFYPVAGKDTKVFAKNC